MSAADNPPNGMGGFRLPKINGKSTFAGHRSPAGSHCPQEIQRAKSHGRPNFGSSDVRTEWVCVKPILDILS